MRNHQTLSKGKGLRSLELLAVPVLVFALFLAAGAAAAEIPADLDTMILEQLRERERSQEHQYLRERIGACLEAGVPPGHLSPMVRHSLESGVEPEDLGLMLREMERAGQSGLPTGPMAEKAQEGLVKKVGPQAIVRAMERNRERMNFCAGLVDDLGRNRFQERERVQLIGETSSAIASGMKREHVREIFREMAGDEEIDNHRIMATARFMKRVRGAGVQSGTVRDMARETIRHRYSEQEMEQIMAGVANANRYGRSAEMEASRIRRQLRQDQGEGRGHREGGPESGGGGAGSSGSQSGGNGGGSGGSGSQSGGNGGSGGSGGGSGGSGSGGGSGGSGSQGGSGGGTGGSGSGGGSGGSGNQGGGGSGSGGSGGQGGGGGGKSL